MECLYIYNIFAVYEVSFSSMLNRRHCISKNEVVKDFQSVTIGKYI